MSEEKKLTDEEIVKALDCGCLAVVYGGYCEKCVLYEENCHIVPDAIVALIHRLQDENKTLKSPKYGRWKVKFFNAQDEIAELKKQVDELLQEKGYLIERRNAGKKQAVKDTAKEVYGQVLEWIPVWGGYQKFVDDFEGWLKERYGIEVE